MKVYAPNKGYTGVSASVAFCNGVGYTGDPYLIKWFRDHGYRAEEEAVPSGEEMLNELPREVLEEEKKAGE